LKKIKNFLKRTKKGGHQKISISYAPQKIFNIMKNQSIKELFKKKISEKVQNAKLDIKILTKIKIKKRRRRRRRRRIKKRIRIKIKAKIKIKIKIKIRMEI